MKSDIRRWFRGRNHSCCLYEGCVFKASDGLTEVRFLCETACWDSEEDFLIAPTSPPHSGHVRLWESRFVSLWMSPRTTERHTQDSHAKIHKWDRDHTHQNHVYRCKGGQLSLRGGSAAFIKNQLHHRALRWPAARSELPFAVISGHFTPKSSL